MLSQAFWWHRFYYSTKCRKFVSYLKILSQRQEIIIKLAVIEGCQWKLFSLRHGNSFKDDKINRVLQFYCYSRSAMAIEKVWQCRILSKLKSRSHFYWSGTFLVCALLMAYSSSLQKCSKEELIRRISCLFSTNAERLLGTQLFYSAVPHTRKL